MLKKIAKLNKNELTKVAGGTVKECKELVDAYGGPEALGFFGAMGYCGNMNQAYAIALENALKKDFNIDAYVSVGWSGTGFRETADKYSINGKNISHQDVIAMIKAA